VLLVVLVVQTEQYWTPCVPGSHVAPGVGAAPASQPHPAEATHDAPSQT
jgi:hypothetical protein